MYIKKRHVIDRNISHRVIITMPAGVARIYYIIIISYCYYYDVNASVTSNKRVKINIITKTVAQKPTLVPNLYYACKTLPKNNVMSASPVEEKRISFRV